MPATIDNVTLHYSKSKKITIIFIKFILQYIYYRENKNKEHTVLTENNGISATICRCYCIIVCKVVLAIGSCDVQCKNVHPNAVGKHHHHHQFVSEAVAYNALVVSVKHIFCKYFVNQRNVDPVTPLIELATSRS